MDAVADIPAEPERAPGAPVAEASQSISAPYAGRHGVSAKPMLFLSHAGADTEAARALKRRLEGSSAARRPAAREQGLKVWFDKDDLRAGTPWQEQLEQLVERRATACAVYVGSKGVVNWVEAEVRLALSRAISGGGHFPFVPIIAKAAVGSAALPGFARQFHAVRDVENKPEEFQKLLEAVLGRSEEAGALRAEAEPFFGLRSIDEERSHLFFGRERETQDLIQRLWKQQLLAVVGDSGSGKSSLVKAGLVPGAAARWPNSRAIGRTRSCGTSWSSAPAATRAARSARRCSTRRARWSGRRRTASPISGWRWTSETRRWSVRDCAADCPPTARVRWWWWTSSRSW